MVTTDILVFAWMNAELLVLLIRRKKDPYRGLWAFPGGFVDMDESLEGGALRQLAEETGLRGVSLEQFHAFGDPGRDPRGRTITVAFFGFVASDQLPHARAGDDAAGIGWFPVRRPPPLAFDHKKILEFAEERLRARIRNGPTAFQLLSRKFTLTELQQLYETILRKRLDKRNFRRKVLSLGLLRPLAERRKTGPHRPARLYTFSDKKLGRLRDRRMMLPL